MRPDDPWTAEARACPVPGRKPAREKALLVTVRPERAAPDSRAAARELEHLAASAGADIAGAAECACRRLDPAYFLTLGKREALRQQVLQAGADIVIIDADLSPAQQRNLEDFFSARVVDRTALILDIFAQRARSREGKLQIELAQLDYLMPRLKGRGMEMSRLGGGIGTRGPGETQLETDRRTIKERMKRLRRDLEQVEVSRGVQRRSRAGHSTAALVGYTNAGKSTILNLLSGSSVAAEDRLFSTLDPTLRKVGLPGGESLLVSDTVGFIRDLPHQLIAAFRATLEEVREAELLLHVLDCTSPLAEEQVAAVDRVLSEIGAGDRETIFVINKIDAAEQGIARQLSRRLRPSVAISARTGEGVSDLREMLAGWLSRRRPHMFFRVPAAEAQVIRRLMRSGTVYYSAAEGTDVLIEVRIDRAIAHSLRRFAVPAFGPARG